MYFYLSFRKILRKFLFELNIQKQQLEFLSSCHFYKNIQNSSNNLPCFSLKPCGMFIFFTWQKHRSSSALFSLVFQEFVEILLSILYLKVELFYIARTFFHFPKVSKGSFAMESIILSHFLDVLWFLEYEKIDLPFPSVGCLSIVCSRNIV